MRNPKIWPTNDVTNNHDVCYGTQEFQLRLSCKVQPTDEATTDDDDAFCEADEDVYYDTVEPQDINRSQDNNQSVNLPQAQKYALIENGWHEVTKDLKEMETQVKNLKQRLDYPDDVVVHTIKHNNKATAFFISSKATREGVMMLVSWIIMMKSLARRRYCWVITMNPWRMSWQRSTLTFWKSQTGLKMIMNL
jgi:hypothetical protein